MSKNVISLSTEEVDPLRLLLSHDLTVIEEFCKQVKQFINEGRQVNHKVYNSAAKKLGISPKEVENIIMSLISLLQRCCEMGYDRNQLQDILEVQKFPSHTLPVLVNLYLEVQDRLLTCLWHDDVQVPTLTGVDWRLDVINATRSLHNIVEPVISLHLHTNNTEADTPLKFQTDASTLLRITATLEDAVQQSRSSHHSKIHNILT